MIFVDYIYNKVKVVAGIFLLLLSLYGCKPQVPDEYIQPNQFEDILYDYHLAIAMGNQQTSNQVVNNIQKNAYILAALKNITYPKQILTSPISIIYVIQNVYTIFMKG